jgi:DnaJ-class molecular chaperone
VSETTQCVCSQLHYRNNHDGSRDYKLKGKSRCRFCHGSGYVAVCEECDGAGVVNNAKCYPCNGSGKRSRAGKGLL